MTAVSVSFWRNERKHYLELVDCGPREGLYVIRGLRERRLCAGLTEAFEAKYARHIEEANRRAIKQARDRE